MTIEIVKDTNLIYDIGMHKGEDTEFYLKKGFRVIGFEADPDLVLFCKTRFEGAIKENRLIIVEGAIVDKDFNINENNGKVKFYKNTNQSLWGTVREDWRKRNEMLGTTTKLIEVRPVDFSGCIRQYGMPYYMKIDIEGCDAVCVKSLMDFKLRPDYISIESEKVDFSRLKMEFDILYELGYTKYKCIEQSGISLQVPPYPSLEGSYNQHSFMLGSSGLFGKELPGAWKSKKEILADCKKIFIIYSLFGDSSLLRKSKLGMRIIGFLQWITKVPLSCWYDTHAKHSSVK